MEVHCFLQQGGNELVIQSCRSVTDGNGAAAEHLGNDQIHHKKTTTNVDTDRPASN